MADELWSGDRATADKPVREVLAGLGVPPDFESRGEPDVDYIHRRAGETEIYFVRNLRAAPLSALCTFRVCGRQPELWDAVTGQTRLAEAFAQTAGRTTLPLEFPPYGSLFVIFRKPIPAEALGTASRNFPVCKSVQEVGGPWTVQFDPKWGGPTQPVVFDALSDWTRRAEEGIKYYSGTATYRTTFNAPALPAGRSVFLDLGTVHETAAVRLNGMDLGVVWCPPWRVDIAAALRPGQNLLEIDVANLWPNRLIGDSRLPADKRFTKTNVAKFYNAPRGGSEHSLLPSGLLGPVSIAVSSIETERAVRPQPRDR